MTALPLHDFTPADHHLVEIQIPNDVKHLHICSLGPPETVDLGSGHVSARPISLDVSPPGTDNLCFYIECEESFCGIVTDGDHYAIAFRKDAGPDFPLFMMPLHPSTYGYVPLTEFHRNAIRDMLKGLCDTTD